MTKRGLFISFEGGEGAGKTTQINALAQNLTERGHKVVATREPGGTTEGEKIRNLLVQREGGAWTPMSEALLLYAARLEHVEKIIRPALAKGKIVISDRFADSTFAYQGYGHGLDLDKLRELHALTLGDFQTDMTFILDVDPAAGLRRSSRRLAAESLQVNQTEDRFESLALDFHERLRAGFIAIARSDAKRCRVIDASQKPVDMAEEIFKIVEERLR